MNPFARHTNGNQNWSAPAGGISTWEQAAVFVLMDIRAELQRLNAVFACQNFLDVPKVLRAIKTNTRKPKRRRTRRA